MPNLFRRTPSPRTEAAPAAADALSDRAVALAMLMLSVSAAASYGTPRAVLIAGAWGAVSALAAAVTALPSYRGRARAAVAATLRIIYSAFLQLFVASGRRAPVAIATHTEFWASRVGPLTVFLYAVTARLPRRIHRPVLIATAAVALLFQPAACVAISACYPGIDAIMARMVAAGARAATAAAAAVAGVGVSGSARLAPCPHRTCFLVMTWCFWVGLIAADVLAQPDTRSPARRAAVKIALRSAGAFAALIAADAVAPCAPLPVLGGVDWPLCVGGAVDPPIKRLLRGGGGAAAG